MKRHKRCVVCDEPLMPLSYQNQTCGDPHCLAVMNLQPCVRDPRKTRTKKSNVGKPWAYSNVAAVGQRDILPTCSSQELDTIRGLFIDMKTSSWYWGEENLTADLRGILNKGRNDPWGITTRVSVALRGTTKAGAVFMHVTRKAGQSSADATREALRISLENIHDLWLVWTCQCEAKTGYTLENLSDMPDEPGPHGNCPVCGATALHVEVLDE